MGSQFYHSQLAIWICCGKVVTKVLVPNSKNYKKIKKKKKETFLFQLSLFYTLILSIMLGTEYRLINALNTLECKYISKTGCMSYHNIFTLFLN